MIELDLHYSDHNTLNLRNKTKQNLKELTVFQPSGSRNEVILVLSPGIGPGCRVTFPPSSWVTRLTTSPLLYTSSVLIAT